MNAATAADWPFRSRQTVLLESHRSSPDTPPPIAWEPVGRWVRLIVPSFSVGSLACPCGCKNSLAQDTFTNSLAPFPLYCYIFRETASATSPTRLAVPPCRWPPNGATPAFVRRTPPIPSQIRPSPIRRACRVAWLPICFGDRYQSPAYPSAKGRAGLGMLTESKYRHR